MEEDDLGYSFTTDWFSGHIPNWQRAFSEHVGRRPRVLEIGSYEGRSAVWIMERLSTHHDGGELYCIDPWIGNDFRTQSFNMSNAEVRFDENMKLAQSRYQNTILHKIREKSVDGCALLLLESQLSFDVIYVDGAHSSQAALTDLVMCHYLCKSGGLIIVDDYLWDYEGSILSGPKPGVDAYTNIFSDEVRMLRYYPTYQVFLKKMTSET
jgi:predicted O-methyltransferase YrrM